MVSQEKEETRSKAASATPKQVHLIKDLYSETGYKRKYSDDDLFHMENKEAQKHIDFLIGYKRAQINGNGKEKPEEGFNKIEFGMIYKLCWRYCGEHPNPTIKQGNNFLKLVAMEYTAYKKAMAYTKAQTAKKAGA